ncbi:MAG: hypothetical protein H6649_03260 [Caldilineae bacterium]|nr:hypothetical protein [Caldilineae bacterium]
MNTQDTPSSLASDGRWSALYKAGAVAALLAVFVFRRNLGAELSLLASFGLVRGVPVAPPTIAAEWFGLFHDNRLVALTYLNFFDLFEYALLGLVFLALWAALRRASPGAMLVATTAGLIGIAVYFASNQSLAMLALSERYTATASDAQRSAYLVAGEALLAANNPDGIYQGAGIYISLFLVLLAGLIISVVIWRSCVFGKAAAITGLLANGIGMCYFVTLALLPSIYWLPHPISAPFRVIWYFLIALRLFRLGRKKGNP